MKKFAMYVFVNLIAIVLFSSSLSAQGDPVSFIKNGSMVIFNRDHQNLLNINIIDSGFYECRLFQKSDSTYVLELSNTDKKNLIFLQKDMSYIEGDKLISLITQRFIDLKINIPSTHLINDSIYTWKNSLFIAAGYGYPLGVQFELGYNFGVNFSYSISIGTNHIFGKPSE